MSPSELARSLALAAGIAGIASAGCGGAPIAIHGDIGHPTTNDGWSLTVEHFAPAPGATPRKRPVVLCHGILATRRFFELEGEDSLPIVLARDGFDVWLVDLRGRPEALASHHLTSGYDVDTFMRSDLDALLRYVVTKSGAKDVTWLGHSLGGMVAYARLGTIDEPRIGALVTVGSPGTFAPASHHMVRFDELSPALSILPWLPVGGAAWLEGTIGVSLAPSLLTDTIFQPGSISRETYRLLERTAVNDPSKGELRQLLRSVHAGAFVSADGSVSYTDALRAIRVPALVIVGRADELADPLVGREVFERLGSSDKELLVAGKGEGFSADFGHVDLLVGPAARHEIFPPIVRFLEEHDPK